MSGNNLSSRKNSKNFHLKIKICKTIPQMVKKTTTITMPQFAKRKILKAGLLFKLRSCFNFPHKHWEKIKFILDSVKSASFMELRND